ncbi:SLATT domain-containing protein [Tenacibaculum retecalamus]|uniref:SLATT domain-containing protein n=1 Tax=Tenacibaculum retecalamus TaxID=3018315 RepID=UPI0023D8EB34|nr:SLATT domain-containing protein [Tenacibaculum retecalamus]WBX72007.1 SLATT domain-containing protein [Tenacibaculum retecalamus]
MTKPKSFEKPEGKRHLDKNFSEELKHKLWSTKGIRFYASDRLKGLSKTSNICSSVLSVYLIIFGLLSVYNIYNPSKQNENLFAFSITAISIGLLIFSIFESSQNYLVKAEKFHDCSLYIADLYNELQNFKSYQTESTDTEILDFCSKLQIKCQNILRRYNNHSQLDTYKFRADNMEYYKYLKWYYWWGIQIFFL